MERQDLTWLETLTVEQFKRKEGVEIIHVKRSKNDPTKMFFTAGNIVGAVSTKKTNGALPGRPMISLVQGEATDRNPDGKFYMLHEEADGAPDIATF